MNVLLRLRVHVNMWCVTRVKSKFKRSIAPTNATAPGRPHPHPRRPGVQPRRGGRYQNQERTQDPVDGAQGSCCPFAVLLPAHSGAARKNVLARRRARRPFRTLLGAVTSLTTYPLPVPASRRWRGPSRSTERYSSTTLQTSAQAIALQRCSPMIPLHPSRNPPASGREVTVRSTAWHMEGDGAPPKSTCRRARGFSCIPSSPCWPAATPLSPSVRHRSPASMTSITYPRYGRPARLRCGGRGWVRAGWHSPPSHPCAASDALG